MLLKMMGVLVLYILSSFEVQEEHHSVPESMSYSGWGFGAVFSTTWRQKATPLV